MRARRIAIAVTLGVALGWTVPTAEPPREMNLYDWMFPAEVIVSGRPEDQAGKLTAVRVEGAYRGAVEAGETIQVHIRKTNREREDFEDRLVLDPEKSYLFLLKPAPRKKDDAAASYTLIRGVHGTREIPAEGASTFLDAVTKFALLQSVNSEELHWHSFGLMLEEINPVLIRTALDEFLKFRRETPELTLRVRPLLRHPRPDIRERALQVSARILQRYPRGDLADPEGMEMEIIALARRDPSVDVRIAATRALAGLADAGIEAIWEEISEDDPDQTVRYEAERLLYEREIEIEAESDG